MVPERIEPFGEAALLVVLGDRVDPALALRAQRLAGRLDGLRAAAPGIGRPVPAHASVLVPFDPLSIHEDAVRELIRRAVADSAADVDEATDDGPGSMTEIHVRYGGPDGVDLEDVAAAHDLRPADVVELHASARHLVLFLGFAPGFAYVAGLPAQLATPRRDRPRERVPAGSVAISGELTGLYPTALPGGWNLIGRTDDVLWDPRRPEPSLLRPGAFVRFVPAR